MSDKPEAAGKPADEDVDELPGESAPSEGASQLSLEEQIAQLADLEIEDDPKAGREK